MRHLKSRHKLGVTTAHRSALLANLAVALITQGRIKTTLAKAKALRPFIEKVVTFAKKAHAVEDPAQKLHYFRQALSKLRDPDAVTLLFDERAQEFSARNGGYTRIYKLLQRRGDASSMALIELIAADDEGYGKRRRKGGAKKAGATAPKPEASGEADDEPEADAEEPVAEASEGTEAETDEVLEDEVEAPASEGDETAEVDDAAEPDEGPEKKD